jgi:hypothetical protein
MSLLNEALKRASQSQQEHDTVRIHFKPLPPAPAPPPPAGRGRTLPVIVILVIAAVIAFIGLAHLGRRVTMAAAVPPATPTVPGLPRPIVPKLAVPKRAVQPATGRAVAVTTPASVWPSLKVQGITYYNAKWQAIVNGKTVYAGESLNGFRVAVIYRNYVLFVAPDGSKKMVPLGE